MVVLEESGMLHVLDPRSTGPSSRRQWLQLGGLGLMGLSLPGLLRAENSRRSAAPARSCVLLLLHGGPSQLDTWDMKPDAPAEVRGEFQPIRTSVAGMHIVEHLPRLARLAHHFSIIRSMTHSAINHNAATYFVTTGQPPPREQIAFTPTENDFPHLGAQLAYAHPGRGTVPAAVSLPDPSGDGPYITPGQNGGFLGARFAPFTIHGDPSADDFTVEGLQSEPELRAERFTSRRRLLLAVNEHLGRLGDDRRLDQLDRYQQRAFGLLTSSKTRRAFALDREPDWLRARYGRHKYGQSLLLARRLIEAGVRLVTVYWGGRVNNPLPYWDTHTNNNQRLKEELLPPFDQCFAAFLEDLAARGLLDSTLVVCTGEFGRTPRFGQFTGNGVNDTGRDHWSQCYSMIVAGGSGCGGRVLGRSDRFAAYPASDPFTPQDLTASLLNALGLDPALEVRDAFDRAVPLSAGQNRPELFQR
jgi:hypothetical protein